MKKILKRKGYLLILIGLILMNILPQMLDATLMSLRNDFLTNFDMGLMSFISGLISYILISIGCSRFYDNKNISKGLYYGLPLLGSYLISIVINNIIPINIVNLIICGFIYSLGLIFTITFNKNRINRINIKFILKVILISLLIYIIPQLLIGLISYVINTNVFNLSIILGLIYGILVTIGFMISSIIIEKDFNIENNNFKKIKLIISLSCLVLFIVTLFINNNQNSNVLKVDNLVGYSLAAGDYAFDEKDILAARDFYQNAKNYQCAYLYAIDNSSDISGCDGELLELFKILNQEDALNQLKQKVNTKNVNSYDLEALMKLMKDNNDQDINKITKLFINDLRFQRETVLPFDLSDKEKEQLKTDLSKYDKHIIIRKYIDIYVDWLNEGEFNSTVINTASKIALENPEEVGLQAEAIKFFISAPENVHGNSSVVDNFVNLTKEAISKQSDEKIINYKTFVAYAYAACDAQSKLITFLESYEKDKLSEDMGTILLTAYKKKGEHQKASEMALKVLKINEYNVSALAYLSIYKLQSNLDESINYALNLSKIIEDKKDNYLDADIALGMYRVYLTGYYESPDSNFCPYHNFYRDMTEEQQNKLKNNEILNGYIIGSGVSEENFSKFSSIVDKYNYVSYFRYYRGSYYVNHKEFKKAVEDLEYATKELGNKHPFFYSELGFAYEGIGDLRKSLEAFETADKNIDELGLGSLTYNYNNIHNYFSVYINNAKHAMYESEGEHNE